MTTKNAHHYLWEKLHVAVSSLSSSDRPLRYRLANAWASALVRLREDDIPAEIRPRWDAMYALATSVSDPERGSIDASTRALSDEDAEKMAQEIVSLYDWVCHTRGPHWAL